MTGTRRESVPGTISSVLGRWRERRAEKRAVEELIKTARQATSARLETIHERIWQGWGPDVVQMAQEYLEECSEP